MSADTRPDEPGSVDQELLTEIEHLSRLVADQERIVTAAVNEMRRSHAALGWRAQLRFEKIGARLLRNPLTREPYRMARRAFEIWVDHGFVDIFRFAKRKIGSAARGRSLSVDDHTWEPPEPDEYRQWLQRNVPTADAYAAMRVARAAFKDAPLISVVIAGDPPETPAARRTIESIHAQIYDRWELCTAPTHAEAFRGATGAVIAFVNVGDVLVPEALFEVVKRLNDDPAADIVYSDQDFIDAAGRLFDPFFKPEWDPELLFSTNILGPFTVMRRRVVERAGGLRPELGAGQPYDLMLRASEQTQQIHHVAKVLCHLGPREATRDRIVWRHAAARDERRALDEALARRQRPGCVEPLFTTRGPRCYTTRFRLTQRPLVSIIIPTRDQAALLRTTIDSILTRTDYDAYEIVVIDNNSVEPDAVAYLASLRPPCQVHRWTAPFNYSAINNFGVRQGRGEQLLFLNNDVEVLRADWLTAMLEYAQFDAVGSVGAKLLYTDGTIQHAGVVLNVGGVAQHAFRCTAKEVPGVPRLAELPRNCSAVTGACMMVPRRVFDKVGGFDEALRVVLNDIDLCLRIREHGYEVVYTPHALLYHHEGASRGRVHPPEDEERFVARWSAQLGRVDPYYNPNLSDTREDWSLKLDL
ncbi:MAG TPA: glycosyltransferase [Vicinamibacterales bacterium]|jgi:GT2 family glycosyltransferase|nr:glycosyltransferase [Vicinamibacterales bacterium]